MTDNPKPVAERVSAAIAKALDISSNPDFLATVALNEYSLVLIETDREVTVRESKNQQVKDSMLSYYYETQAENERQAELHMSYGREMAAKVRQINNPNWAAGHFLYQLVNPQGYWESGLDDVLDMFISCYASDKIFPKFLKLHELLISGEHNEDNVLDWGDVDGSICYIPHDKLKIVVYHNFVSLGEYPDWIAVYDPAGYSKKLFVRAIRTNEDKEPSYDEPYTLEQYRSIDFKIKFDKDSPIRLYGDCRDNGHILTFDTVGVVAYQPQADKANWTYRSAMHFAGDLSHMVDEVNDYREHIND